MDLAPIVLFCYNRPLHTLKVLKALKENELADQSVLYIFADGSKENTDDETIQQINELRKIIRLERWTNEVHIIEQPKNIGLADSIVSGITSIVNQYGKIIILEDDTLPSKGFLKFMNEVLELYKEDEKVMNISGYLYPINLDKYKQTTFFSRVAAGWGWATWARAWKHYEQNIDWLISQLEKRNLQAEFDVDNTHLFSNQLIDNKNNKIHTWGIRWYASWLLNNGYNLFPKHSLIRNIGFDHSGENCTTTERFKSSVTDYLPVHKINISEDKAIRNKLKLYFLKYLKTNSVVRRQWIRGYKRWLSLKELFYSIK